MGDRNQSPEGMLTAEIRWPRVGDRLLRQASWDSGARFADHPIARETHLWRGYMSAGATLVAKALDDETLRHDLAYPILFNYRHGLELAIKSILNSYGEYAGVLPYNKSHDLNEVWRLCRLTVAALGGDRDDEAISVVEQLVAEFSTIDPDSFAFRYATKKNGATINLPDWSIDIENVRDVMEGVDAFFTGLDGFLDAQTWVISDILQHQGP